MERSGVYIFLFKRDMLLCSVGKISSTVKVLVGIKTHYRKQRSVFANDPVVEISFMSRLVREICSAPLFQRGFCCLASPGRGGNLCSTLADIYGQILLVPFLIRSFSSSILRLLSL